MPLPTATIRTQVSVPLRFADGYATAARVFSFDGLVDGQEHLAFGLGDRAAALTSGGRGPVPLVRPHSECLTGDVFGSQRCDCGPQLREAVERIADSGGFLLYLRQEGRGIGLYAKLDAYALQDTGLDTYEANLALGHGEDERSYLVAAQMLQALGVSRVALLSNNPDKARQLRRFGVTVAALVPTGVHLSAANARYLATKARRGAHTFDFRLSAGATGRRLRAECAEEAVAERVHRPDRRLRAGPHAVLPAPPGDLVQHRRVVGDDRDRHVVTRALPADDRPRLMVAEDDEHEIVVAVVLHEREQGVHGVLDRPPVRRTYPFGVAPELGLGHLVHRNAVEDRAVADVAPVDRAGGCGSTARGSTPGRPPRRRDGGTRFESSRRCSAARTYWSGIDA